MNHVYKFACLSIALAAMVAEKVVQAAPTANVAPQPAVEYFVVVADGLEEQTYTAVQQQLWHLISHAASGDYVYLVEGKGHQTIGTFEVLAGNARARIRNPDCARALKNFGEFVKSQKSTGQAADAGKRQVSAPRLTDTIR